jgi:predicted transcriptional regulator of viral defense system
MKLAELGRINKLYFGHEEIARVLGINAASAKVTAGRYVRQGWLLRLKKNIYIRREVWNALDREDKFMLANLGQVPSYLSLSTALDYYEITTQGTRDYFESMAVKRTKEIIVAGSVFRYTKIKETLYSGFKKERGFFIATPEKALLDAFYLMSLGRYALDLSALDGTKIEREKLRSLSQAFPQKTKALLKTHGYLAKA